MTQLALKICGLKDPMIARQAVNLGVGYIGLVFHEPSKRYVELQQACDIAAAVHEAGGLVVPVFVEQRADQILVIAEKLQADLVQLHGVAAIKAYADITPHYGCMIAMPYCESADSFDQERDFLLYDAPIPGGGSLADWSAITVNARFRFFIAGGINRDTIVAARDYFQPFGFDISTGVESSPGVKDIGLIEEIIAVL